MSDRRQKKDEKWWRRFQKKEGKQLGQAQRGRGGRVPPVDARSGRLWRPTSEPVEGQMTGPSRERIRKLAASVGRAREQIDKELQYFTEVQAVLMRSLASGRALPPGFEESCRQRLQSYIGAEGVRRWQQPQETTSQRSSTVETESTTSSISRVEGPSDVPAPEASTSTSRVETAQAEVSARTSYISVAREEAPPVSAAVVLPSRQERVVPSSDQRVPTGLETPPGFEFDGYSELQERETELPERFGHEAHTAYTSEDAPAHVSPTENIARGERASHEPVSRQMSVETTFSAEPEAPRLHGSAGREAIRTLLRQVFRTRSRE